MADCGKLKTDQLAESNDLWDKTLADVAVYIKDQLDKGLDPQKFNPGPGKNLVNLLKLAEDYKAEKDKQATKISKQVDDECKPDAVEILQSLVNVAIVLYTEGISLLLPKYMTHIDVSEILKGKPLGGEGSILNQVRGAMMRGLGIDEKSDLGKTILNPGSVVNDLKKAWENDNGDVGNAIKKIFG